MKTILSMEGPQQMTLGGKKKAPGVCTGHEMGKPSEIIFFGLSACIPVRRCRLKAVCSGLNDKCPPLRNCDQRTHKPKGKCGYPEYRAHGICPASRTGCSNRHDFGMFIEWREQFAPITPLSGILTVSIHDPMTIAPRNHFSPASA
jgi:hypothetical protein